MAHTQRDWVGNAGVRNTNIRRTDAEVNDYYATDPHAVELLLEQETFSQNIWEPACGEGHISGVLENHGYSVISTDLVDRGYGEVMDFFEYRDPFDGDIITNPPYSKAKEFVAHALELVTDGHKVAMFLKLTFLEGQGRRELFRNHPPRTIYVASARLKCAKNGDFEHTGASMVAYAWYIWQKGYDGPTVIKWIN